MLEQVDDLRLDGHVQRCDGLVRHQQLRLHGQRPGDGDALAHAAGQLRGILVQIAGVEAHVLELELGLGAQGSALRADVVDGHGLGDDVRHGHVLIEA